MLKRRIYLDFATTTPLDKKVERAMRPFWFRDFGNAGSLHAEGTAAKKALDAARLKVARLLEAHSSEILFTSGGTEANNLAILGTIRALESKGTPLSEMHAVTTNIEHSSVMNCFKELERRGMKVSYAPVGADGIVRVESLKKLLTPETVLVSVMYANNEIGTLQPVGRIGALIENMNVARVGKKILFHTDACQAPLYLTITQNHLRADLITLDAHKMYGPKGVGALYAKRTTPLTPLFLGGEQERGVRPGTVPVGLIIGFSEAFSLAAQRREKDSKNVKTLRNYFIEHVRKEIPGVVLNGDCENRLPSNVNISITGRNAEFTVVELDALGIACSAKSACLEGDGESYVVKALGRNDGSERSSIRFSLGRMTGKRDIRHAVVALKEILSRRRT